jgi:hypothetical protein
MTKPIWYFADGDVERGPITEAQLRTLIGTGNLAAEDLVWKEGMEDWMPAGEVPGLFDEQPAPPGSEEPELPAEEAEPSPAPEPATPRRVARTAAALSRPVLPSVDLTEPLPVFRFATFLGQPLVAIGFVLVLLSRGCDSLGDRNVNRIKAKAKVVQDQFQDEWDEDRRELERREAALEAEADTSLENRDSLKSVREELDKLDKDRQKEQEDLQTGRWRRLDNAARDAESNNAMWGYWRECLFWFAAFLFSAGLLIVGFTGQGPERWLCLVMLAIVVFSLFVGRL